MELDFLEEYRRILNPIADRLQGGKSMILCRFVANSVQDQHPASKSAVCEFPSLQSAHFCWLLSVQAFNDRSNNFCSYLLLSNNAILATIKPNQIKSKTHLYVVCRRRIVAETMAVFTFTIGNVKQLSFQSTLESADPSYFKLRWVPAQLVIKEVDWKVCSLLQHAREMSAGLPNASAQSANDDTDDDYFAFTDPGDTEVSQPASDTTNKCMWPRSIAVSKRQ